MTSPLRSGPAPRRGLQHVPRESTCPGAHDPALNVYLPGTAFSGDSLTLDNGPRGPRYALPLRLFVEPSGTHLRATPRGHIEAGPCAGPQLDAEIIMVENCTTFPLDVEMTGSTACPDAEHFSGYIITTGRTR